MKIIQEKHTELSIKSKTKITLDNRSYGIEDRVSPESCFEDQIYTVSVLRNKIPFSN